MTEEKKEFWKTKCYGLQDGYFFGLIKKLNEFYEDKFTIGTNVFYEDGKWCAIVHFKVPPEKKNEKSI